MDGGALLWLVPSDVLHDLQCLLLYPSEVARLAATCRHAQRQRPPYVAMVPDAVWHDVVGGCLRVVLTREYWGRVEAHVRSVYPAYPTEYFMRDMFWWVLRWDRYGGANVPPPVMAATAIWRHRKRGGSRAVNHHTDTNARRPVPSR